MAALIDHSRIINPIIRSLHHLSIVAVALPLVDDFDIETLDMAFLEIQSGSATVLDENRKIICDRAKEKLLFIPSHLRKAVLEAAHGMKLYVYAWTYQHPRICKSKKGEDFFKWRSDGTINTIQTAQQVVLDRNINIKKRFDIACWYGLEGSVRNLWAEMKASEKATCSRAANNPMVRFWIRWLEEGCLVPWTKAAVEYLYIPAWHYRNTIISAFFPKLGPEDRRKFLNPLLTSRHEEFQLCAYAMTKEEQEEVIRMNPIRAFYMYLHWPLQEFFLEMARKLLDFITAEAFCVLLNHIARLESRRDFDYGKLLVELWESSPEHLKKDAGRDRNLMRKIYSSGILKRIGSADDNNESVISKTINSDANMQTKRPRKTED